MTTERVQCSNSQVGYRRDDHKRNLTPTPNVKYCHLELRVSADFQGQLNRFFLAVDAPMRSQAGHLNRAFEVVDALGASGVGRHLPFPLPVRCELILS